MIEILINECFTAFLNFKKYFFIKICLIKKLVFIFAHRKRSLSTQLIKKGGGN